MSKGTPKGGMPKPTEARFAVAANLKHLMENYRASGFSDAGITAPELERQMAEAGLPVSVKTIKRALNAYDPTSPNLDSLDALAAFFEVKTWELVKKRPIVSPRLEGTEEQTLEVAVSSPRIAHQNAARKRSGR